MTELRQADPTNHPVDQRGAVGVLTAATGIGSLGLAAGGTAGALLAVEITGARAAAGLPIGLVVAGSALGAVAISAVNARAGRATGLVVGYALGVTGAAGVIVAAIANSFAGILAASTIMGAANVAVFLARYAAADLVPAAARGRSIGLVLFGASAGAIASPVLLGPSERAAAVFGLPRFTGLYVVAIVAFALAGALVLVVRRDSRPGAAPVPVRMVLATVRPRRFGGALAVLAVTNLLMVAIMAIAPVHLTSHGHDLDAVGLVVAAHVLFMFAPAPLTGWLTDRFGPRPVALLGAALFVAAGGVGAGADPQGTVAMTAGLVVLGVAWNAGVVAGSAMLMDSAPRETRAWAEGFGETAMGTAAAIGAPVAGVVAAAGGFATLTAAGAGIAVLTIIVFGSLVISSTKPIA